MVLAVAIQKAYYYHLCFKLNQVQLLFICALLNSQQAGPSVEAYAYGG